jgi:hypothetical protein
MDSSVSLARTSPSSAMLSSSIFENLCVGRVTPAFS